MHLTFTRGLTTPCIRNAIVLIYAVIELHSSRHASPISPLHYGTTYYVDIEYRSYAYTESGTMHA